MGLLSSFLADEEELSFFFDEGDEVSFFDEGLEEEFSFLLEDEVSFLLMEDEGGEDSFFSIEVEEEEEVGCVFEGEGELEDELSSSWKLFAVDPDFEVCSRGLSVWMSNGG